MTEKPMAREPESDQQPTSVATSGRSSAGDGEPCSCGRFQLPRWCGTYGTPGETHTRAVCGPDGSVELNPVRAQLLAHLHPHEITDVQAWAIMCALINAFDLGMGSQPRLVDGRPAWWAQAEAWHDKLTNGYENNVPHDGWAVCQCTLARYLRETL